MRLLPQQMPSIEGVEGQSFLDVLVGKSPLTCREYAYAAFNYFHQPTPEQFFPREQSLIGIIATYGIHMLSGQMDIKNTPIILLM